VNLNDLLWQDSNNNNGNNNKNSYQANLKNKLSERNGQVVNANNKKSANLNKKVIT
jgi:hypothetical protein